MTVLTRQYFLNLDKGDSLASFRDRFHIPSDTIYLDGNSLGLMPKAVPQRMNQLLEKEWAEDLITSWNKHEWFQLPHIIGDKIAQLIGADAGEVVVTDTVSVNIFKLAAAALSIQAVNNRFTILTEVDNFPTDLYMLQGLEKLLGAPVELITVEREQLESAIDDTTAAVLLTDVNYKNGHLIDKLAITATAHKKGALVIWDLCHSAGAMPVDLNGIDADMAVGCGYKYLNGGPGAPSFVYVAKRWHSQISQPLSGWWAHARPFEFESDYQPAAGIGRLLCGTQSVLALSALEIAVDLMLEADLKLIRDKSLAMSDLLIQCVDEQCAGEGFTLQTSRIQKDRGSQVSYGHANGYAIMQALIANGVTGDFRAPDTLRFGLTPLTLRYVDIYDAVQCLQKIMRESSWQHPQFQIRSEVT